MHNSYLQVLAELGAIGLAAFLTVIGRSLLLALRAARTFGRSGDYEAVLSRGFLVGTIAMLIAYFFATNQYEKQLWLLLAIGPALLSVARAYSSATEHVDATVAGASVPRAPRTPRVPRLTFER